jgi:hypothetical protein
MTRYAIFLVAPVVGGILIAVVVLLISGLRERREQKLLELREARRPDGAPLSARPAPDVEDRRIAS